MFSPIRHAVFLAIALGLSAPLAAQQAKATADDSANRTARDPSSPHEVAGIPNPVDQQDSTPRDTPSSPAKPAASSGKTTNHPGRNEATAAVSDAPYGTGYEARQRGFGSRRFGGFGGGGRGGYGGGRGSGRGR